MSGRYIMGRFRDVESDVETKMAADRSQCQSWTGMIFCCAVSYSCMLVIFVRVCFPDFSLLRLGLLPLFVHGSSPALFYAFSQSPRHFSKPKNIEIVALVPFHQHSRTEILDCYLRVSTYLPVVEQFADLTEEKPFLKRRFP